MKSLPWVFMLFEVVIASPQTSNAATVVHGSRGTVVHTNRNWNSAYWHTNKYGYWGGQRGYWRVAGGKHVFVVVN
jgi:hypothetical protein